jgi:hypothetical protein
MTSALRYCGAYTRDSPQIQWFWRCVAEMSDEDTAKVIFYSHVVLCMLVESSYWAFRESLFLNDVAAGPICHWNFKCAT